MATSNVDTSTNLTADVYGISNYVNEMHKQFNPAVSDDTAMLGIFGYMNQIMSDMYQNSIVMASEFSNESIPTKAKFEKNIIAHALSLGIEDINATPAQMDVLLTFNESDISNWANSKSTWEFVFDKDTPIYIGDFCFHTDYDIQINKVSISNSTKSNKFAYTARYLIDIENPISDITNPYLAPPISINSNGVSVICVKCTLRQVEKNTIHKKILSDNSIASKTTTFEFEGQLAAFNIDVTEGDKTTHLVPVYDGLSSDNKKYPYFNYTYVNSNTIRIKFDRYSYAPRINSDLEINIWTTEGEEGNFTYIPEIYPVFSFESEKYGYSNIGCEVRPITGDSLYGANKKSISDLRELIPKEATSRGSITNLTDLENYFNSINTDDSVLYLYKKRDNALSRLYYTFIIMKDSLGNIIPTNTINIKIRPDQLIADEDNTKLVLQKGQTIKLSGTVGELFDSSSPEFLSDDGSFKYIIPYNFIVNRKPLYGMYYLTIMDTKKFLDFSYINDKCLYQYIATSVNIYRGYIENRDTYEMTITMEQNIDDDADEISGDPTIKCIAVFYANNETTGEEEPVRWANASFISRNRANNTYSYRFSFKTSDIIDSNNMIEITEGMYNIGTNVEAPVYLSGNTKCIIHILSKQGEEYGLNGIDGIVPDLDGYTLSNSYTVVEGMDFFYDYSDIISSVVTVERDSDGNEYYLIKDVPCVKYDYFNTEDKVMNFCKELVKRKNYINYAIDILEDAFGMDFKFVNTYGPASLFTTDSKYTNYVDRTNLSLVFRTKINPGYDASILTEIKNTIKAYIESINSITSLHIPNLITEITNTYRDYLLYFEFVRMNNYDSSVQHMYYKGMPDNVRVPEFLNVNTLSNGEPDIKIEQE